MDSYYYRQTPQEYLYVSPAVIRNYVGRLIRTTIRERGPVTGRLVGYNAATGMADIEITTPYPDFVSVHYSDLIGISPYIPPAVPTPYPQPTPGPYPGPTPGPYPGPAPGPFPPSPPGPGLSPQLPWWFWWITQRR